MIFLGCLALLMAGCNKVETVEVPAEEPTVESPSHLIVDISVNNLGDTRTVKSGWLGLDKVYVVFDHYFTDDETATSSETAYYMTLTFDGSSWNATFSDPALETYLLSRTSGALAAAYCSDFVPQFSFYRGSTSRGNAALQAANYTGFYGFYLFANNVPYTVTDGKLTATLEMSVDPNDVYFSIDAPEVASDRLTFKCEHFTNDRFWGFMRYRTSNTDEGYPVVNYLRPNEYGGALHAAQIPGTDEKYFCGYLKSSAKNVLTEYVIQIIDNKGTPDDDTDDVLYSLTKTDILYGKEAIKLPPLTDSRWVKSFIVPSDIKGFLNGHEWVLMADGRKWATMNVGADREIDGGYLTKWENAEWYIQQYMGDGWRLPTFIEWESLRSNTNHTKSWKYLDSGDLSGLEMVVASGELQGNRVFLPTSGYIDPEGDYWGAYTGRYWSTRLDSSTPGQAYDFYFRDGATGWESINANCKMALRAIVDDNVDPNIDVNFEGFNDEDYWYMSW